MKDNSEAADPQVRASLQRAPLDLDADVTAKFRDQLPLVAEETVAAITVEVSSYAGALVGPMGENIGNAVRMALGGFLDLASRARESDAGTPLAPAVEAAYDLGRGEARSGRSMDALLAAYRVGARVSWRELAKVAVQAGLPADTLASFAEMVFAYIDELSAASVAGHSDELATRGRVRQRYLERLSHSLLAGASADSLVEAASRADWDVPATLTAVILSEAQVRGFLTLADPRTLQPVEDLPGLESADDVAVLLVPEAGSGGRAHLLRALAGRNAVVGPARSWMRVRSSFDRALRAWQLGLSGRNGEPLDTEEHLAEIVLGADPEALADLRAEVLAPLRSLRPATAEKLAETLRSWLLHHGRRDEVAADLFVHPQTVRYRMGQLRELYGERLDDPQTVLKLTLALGRVPGPA